MPNFNVPNNLINGIMDDYRISHFPNPQVLAEKVLKTSATSCSISIPQHNYTGSSKTDLQSTYRVITIPFYMSSEFGFDLSNDFRELVSMGDNQFVDLYNGINAFTGGAQITPQSEAMSTQVWRGSKFSGFKVDCLFVCTNRLHNPVEIIKTICTCCLPRKVTPSDGVLGGIKGVISSVIGTVKTGANTVIDTVLSGTTAEEWKSKVSGAANVIDNLQKDMGMVAPLDYGIKFSTEENSSQPAAPVRGTTVTLQIGDWFRASQLVVTQISGVRFSKEIVAPTSVDVLTMGTDLYQGGRLSAAEGAKNSMGGFPLYAQCSLSLIPASMMYANKFEGYFQNPAAAVANKIKYYGQNYDLP